MTNIQNRLDSFASLGADSTCRLLDEILADAVRSSASDVHFEPTHRSLDVRYRLDGVLHPAAVLHRDLTPNLVARLKVLAELLTYRLDIPQEGRISDAFGRYGADMRVSTFPTIHGEKAVVRLFDTINRVWDLEQLGLPDELLAAVTALLRERSGAIFLTGPSGSGKTTTIYACLRHLLQADGGGRHIVTIEDPVEQALEGVTQSHARPGTEFDFARGLRSLLRQDPDVLMVGEVRDAGTAAIAIEAALTGHLVLTTLHAGSACGVIGRLMEMGIEPYLLTSAVKGIVNQRLVRRVCPACQPGAACAQCAGTGYRGRLLLAELVLLTEPLRRAILSRADTPILEAAATEPGRLTLRCAADKAVANGLTNAQEIDRVLGPS